MLRGCITPCCSCTLCEGAVIEVAFTGFLNTPSPITTFTMTFIGHGVPGIQFDYDNSENTRFNIETALGSFTGMFEADPDDGHFVVVNTGAASGGSQTFEIRFNCNFCQVNFDASHFSFVRSSGTAGTITDTQLSAADSPFDEAQRINLGGTSGGTFTPSWNGVAASSALTYTIFVAPTAAQVQANLETISALSGNVFVVGPASGVFLVVFLNGLAGTNVADPGASGFTFAVTGGTTATATLVADGG